jgi:small-conductance mechanosensitive channel
MPTWNPPTYGRLLLIGTTFVATACATPQTVQEAQKNDRMVSTAIGGIAGTGIGYGIGRAISKDGGALGAALGGITGVIAGQAFGNSTAQKRDEYAQEQNEIETAISAEEKRIAQLTDQADRLNTESKNRASTIAMLRKQAVAKGKITDQARTELAGVKADLDKAKAMRTEVEKYKKDLDAKIIEIERSQAINDSANDPQKLYHQKAELIVKRDKLLKAFTTLNGVEGVLVAQSAQLTSLAKS